MTIIDTSVWIEHFRDCETPIPRLMESRSAFMHPSVHGELLLSGLPRNSPTVRLLRHLPLAPLASPAEVAALIEWAKLPGTGVGYVDAHLLASARVIPEGRLLTTDKRLLQQAERLGIAYQP